MFRHEPSEHKNTIQIEGEMTIYSVSELAGKLIPILNDARLLEINLARVSEIDSAGVQLLMLARKERHETGQELSLVAHSAAVMEVFKLMDLLSYFDAPMESTKDEGGNYGA